MILKFARLVAALIVCGVFVSAANAFMMNYGNFNGTSVMYLDVTESNAGPTALFGVPTIFGDLLDFNPIAFNAASNGPAVVVDGQLNMTVMSSSPNQPLTNLIFNEAGDYTLAGLGPASAQATVGMIVTINVTEVNGAPQFIAGGNHVMTFAPAGSGGNGDWQLPGDAGTTVPWVGHLNIDVAAIAAGATKVDVVLDNTLTAAAANGGSAFIAKKDFRGFTLTIPEPTSAVLAALAGLVTLAIRRQIA